MHRIPLAAATLGLSASAAFAAGVERSPQSVGILFEDGNYGEVTFGLLRPDVTGEDPAGNRSGDMASSFTTARAGFKLDIDDRFDVALIVDEPIGADTAYPLGTGYPLQGTRAELDSVGVTGIVQYRFDERISVHGGLRGVRTEGGVQNLLGIYDLQTSREADLGFLLGAAYEIPGIALRVSLTYNSEITHDFTATETVDGTQPPQSDFSTTIPQSVNLEFQSGIAEDTLVFGSVRWVDWSAFDITPDAYTTTVDPGNALVDYAGSATTVNLGIGRQLDENWALAGALHYDTGTGGEAGNLQPVDGSRGASVSAQFSEGGVQIGGTLRYDRFDTVTTRQINAEFADNSAWRGGVSIGYSF